MKNINSKNIVRGIVTGILLLAVFIAYQNNAQAQTPSCALDNTYLHTGGNAGCAPGILDIAQFELAPFALRTIGANLPSPLSSFGSIGIFRLAGTSIFDNVVAYGNAGFAPTFVGYGAPQPFNAGDSELQVNGTIRIESEASSGASTAEYEPACVTDFGVLVRC